MSLSKVLSLALVVAVARASPVQQPILSPPPQPTCAFCLPTWRCLRPQVVYLNFNSDKNTDKAHLRKLHNVICSDEMCTMSSYGQISTQDVHAPYKRYFPESNEGDDFQTHVKDILGLIAGTSSTDGAIGTVVGTSVVDNLGELHICFVASSSFVSFL